MASSGLSLRPVDRVDVTVVVDLSVDVLLPSVGPANRPPLRFDWSARDALRAEHGYSLLVRTWVGEESHSVIYDAGLSPTTFLWNCDVLEIRPNEIEAILLSHGHADHHGGLEAVFARYGRAGLPVVLHPDARLERRIVFPTGVILDMPPPSVNDLEAEGARVLDEPGPTLWGGDTMLLSGQVDRTTPYEKGFPFQEDGVGSRYVDLGRPESRRQRAGAGARGHERLLARRCRQRPALCPAPDRSKTGSCLRRRHAPHRRHLRADHPCHDRRPGIPGT